MFIKEKAGFESNFAVAHKGALSLTLGTSKGISCILSLALEPLFF